MSTTESTAQNITMRLDRRTMRRAKVLAAKRNTSISGLLAKQIEWRVGEDDAYEQAQPPGARTPRPWIPSRREHRGHA